jgi:HrpA-like RNA helicase
MISFNSINVPTMVAQMPLLRGLPAVDAGAEFFEMLRQHQVIIVRAPTGSGKTTGLTALMTKAGLRVLHTQPRDLACRTTAARLAKALGVKLGDVVGYRTAKQKDMDGPNTRCLVMTDGLAVARLIAEHERHWDVVVTDEVHEGNKNVEVLLGLHKLRLAKNPTYKLVIMSATMDAEALKEFFASAGIKTAMLDIPGRLFPIECRKPGDSLELDAAKFLRQGRNILIFQPGKGEINKCIDTLSKLCPRGAVILPLHAELSFEEQAKCFEHYEGGKIIVATNVAQTSITIDDIDVVLDSGYERRLEVRNGVEVLVLAPISKADSLQRQGRAGRTKPGIYIDYCDVPWDDRPDYVVAEILRTLIDQTYLKLASCGIDLASLDLFHQPDVELIRDAKRVLHAIGCLEGDLDVTETGHEVARLPIPVEAARLVVQSIRHGIPYDGIDCAAILSQRGILDPRNMVNLEQAGGEQQSDLLAQVNVFRHVREKRMSKDDMADVGINVVRYFKAVEHRRLLLDALSDAGYRLNQRNISDEDRHERILKSICAGYVDKVYHGAPYQLNGCGEYNPRQLPERTFVRMPSRAQPDEAEMDAATDDYGIGGRYYQPGVFMVGVPFTVSGDRGEKRLLTLASIVEFDWLRQAAPHLYRCEEEPYYDQYEGCVYVKSRESFGRLTLAMGEPRPHRDHPEAPVLFARWAAEQFAA